MNRRNFLKTATASVCMVAGLTLNPFSTGAFAQDEHPPMDLLNGVIPAGANPAISGLFRFPHHHFVHIPQEILDNPPRDGWLTATSMVVPTLGVGRQLIQQSRQFHYHEVPFTYEQVRDIAAGREVTVEVYLNGQLNHQFLFNGPKSFDTLKTEIQARARRQGLTTTLRGPVVPRRVV